MNTRFRRITDFLQAPPTPPDSIAAASASGPEVSGTLQRIAAGLCRCFDHMFNAIKTSTVDSAHRGILIPALKFTGWAVLGGAASVFLFFWCIIGLGEVFGGTEVGNGRVPGAGILWWVFLCGCVPLCVVGAIGTPLLITRVPTSVRIVVGMIGAISLISIAAVVTGLRFGWL